MLEEITEEYLILDHVSKMRTRWNPARLTLLLSHLLYSIDEVRELFSYDDKSDMLEAEMMLSELIKDLKRLLPDKREIFTRPNSILIKEKKLENEENSEEYE